MRLFALAAAASGLASPILAIATPPSDVLGLAPRQSDTDPCSLADSPAVNASIQLASWMECQVNGFFPYPENGAWDKIYTQTFSPSLLATFNSTPYTFDSWLQTYHVFNVTLGKNFAPFKHGFTSVLAVPNANGDRGGTVYAIGWEGGFHTGLKRDVYFTDAVFAVVGDFRGRRKIVEFRESSNVPNTARLPEPDEWSCGVS